LAEKKITEKELLEELKKHEEFIRAAREKLASRIPYWEKKKEEAEAALAEANKMLALLKGVPAKARPAVRRGRGVREEFMKWFDTLPSGTTVTLKEMSEKTGIPRGTVWGIKEALLDEGKIEEVGRGVYRKL